MWTLNNNFRNNEIWLEIVIRNDCVINTDVTT